MADERGRRGYSRDEVEEILRRAAERTHNDAGDALTHDELVSAAREAGIDVGAIEDAASELAVRREEARAVAAWDARRKRRLASHLITYLIVNAGLFLLNLVTGGVWWFLFPLLGWGIAVALQAASALRAPTPDQIEKVSRKERRRREAEAKRAARRAAAEEMREKFRRARAQRGSAERQFELAVESGVTALMEVVARKIEQAARGPERPLPDSEFNRYVARKKGQAPPGPGPTASTAAGSAAAGGSGARGQAARAPTAQPPREIITPAPRVRVEGAEEEELEDGREGERSGRRRGPNRP